MIASRSGMRNTRGRGFPGCGSGVTPPISRKPKPNAATASTNSPCLSSPAARPSGLGNSSPIAFTGVPWIALPGRPAQPNR